MYKRQVLCQETGVSYISKLPVPAGTEIFNEHYWACLLYTSSAFNSIKSTVSSAMSSLRSTVSSGVASIRSSFNSLGSIASSAYRWGADTVSYTHLIKNLVGDELVASAIKSAMAELGPNEVTNRTKIEPLAQQKLAESLVQKYGEDVVFVNKVVINDMNFEDAYNEAIQQKSIAQQNADKQKDVYKRQYMYQT